MTMMSKETSIKCNLMKCPNETRKVFLIVDTRKHLICSQAGMLFSFESGWPVWASDQQI